MLLPGSRRSLQWSIYEPEPSPAMSQVTCHEPIATPPAVAELPKKRRTNARSAAETAGTKQLLQLQSLTLVHDAHPGTMPDETGDADLEPLLASGADGLQAGHQPTCSSPGQWSQSSSKNMPRSVRLWMERRAKTSSSAPSHESSHHTAPPLAHERNLSAQGVNLAGLESAMGGKPEHVPDQHHAARPVNGSNRSRPVESVHQRHKVVQSVQSSASSHTRLGSSKDWVLADILPGRGLMAAEQHAASEIGSDSRRSASRATQSSWEIDSRTGSSCSASEAAARPGQQRHIYSRSLTASKAACNAGSRGQVPTATPGCQTGLHNRPTRESKGTAKAQPNVQQRRTNNVQVEKQAFR